MFLKRAFSPFSPEANRLAPLLLATLSGLMLSQPALASNVTVASPINGTSVSSPVWVRAHNVGCDGLAPTAFGYSIDNGSTYIKGVSDYDVDVLKQTVGSGTHTIHFKSWTSNGACPVINTTFTVGGGSPSNPSPSPSPTQVPAPSGDSIPSNAVASGNLDGAHGWQYEHDGGTPGSSRGSTSYPATTPSYDDAREFYMTYSSHGGERWHLNVGNSTSATHFVLDSYVYFTDPDQVQNLEMDLNQVMSNGATVIFATQCSSISRTWEYSVRSGGHGHWRSSNIGCNPRNWSAKTWHHIQIGVHRDGNGVVTHDWVNVDGSHSNFQNATGAASQQLGWQHGSILTNFQIDGNNSGSGSITAYIHKMTVYRW